ncbi:TraG/TraD/VirD4 family enzyme, ATPase (plasmid) [Halalkaliarchaeum sp. AArc-CO]|uniref:ATP-binding protein n=1 Tax=Halalkaliarchaeum sp. AArc-CO TaxID=2866381 RepID=UPI00217DD8B9|nr:ATP-binding protein [Halalkaliarchaeum sp. AArc-CO]UWG49180.1 TraG/TraD/VirD4 family enzyme, ATPase [Halalkaliarchaeum sp. AArc-CO]
MKREYLRVIPTSEAIDTENVPKAIASLHKLCANETSSFRTTLNPFSTSTPPRFEFLALSEGHQEPIQFYYGADEHFRTLEKRLRTIYPETFDIEKVDLDLATRLIRPVEYSCSDFANRVQNNNLRYQFDPEEQYNIETDEERNTIKDSSISNTSTLWNLTSEGSLRVNDTVFELARTHETPEEDGLRKIQKPTITPDETILARPSVDSVSPIGVRWYGDATRKQDWMTSLLPFAHDDPADHVTPVEQSGATLATLIEHLMEASIPVAFQVVFQRRDNWHSDAVVRKEALTDGRDTLFQEIVGSVLEVNSQQSGDDLSQQSTSVAKRLDYIDAKNPKRTFTANIRALVVPVREEERKELESLMDALCPVFDPLDGPFYEVVGKRFQSKGFRDKTKVKHARAELQRLLDREITTGRGKTRPDLVLSGKELANFVLVPSSAQLTVEGQRGTRAEQQSRNPLPCPNPDLVGQFDDGMALGYPLDENGETQPTPIRIPPKLLTTHYGRFASTGSGKSKAIINDALSLRETTGGPVVVVDPKGDGMCSNYLRCHYDKFGSVDDVYQFRVPDVVPAFSFFDIRPALAAGRPREDAIQDKVDHFHDILGMIMGSERYERAFVANEILSYLIKALFDKEYGSDVFGLDNLFEAAIKMQREQIIPPVAADNQSVEESLTRHFAKDDHQFQVSMDAVGNRLDKLNEDVHLRRIFSHVPTQADTGEYLDNHFDFRDFLEEDVTLLFDLGDLRPEAQRAITLLLLSNLWDAVQVRRRDDQEEYDALTNLIIEESAPIASTKLVYEQLLPQGRSFGLSMGLVMQFPEQVRNESQRAYDEVLNNVKTKLIGNISIEHDLAESMAHEDLSPTELRNRINTLPSGEWITQLPSPSFGETGPAPFSMKPLPIASGHPESDDPLSPEQAEYFETVVLPELTNRTRREYGLSGGSESEETDEQHTWGSQSTTSDSVETSAHSSTPSESSFIGTTTANSEPGSEDSLGSSELSPLISESESTASTVENQLQTTETERDADTGTERSPIAELGVRVSDETLQNRGLSRDDVRFLDRVLSVMNRESSEYTLLDSMRALRDEYEELNVQRLINQDLLEEASACRRKYYTVLPEGRDLLGQSLNVGPGEGDIGEKTPHKVGVRLLELWLAEKETVSRVECYYEYDEETVFDVAAFDGENTLVWVGEVELPSNNKQAVLSDYDKLGTVDAKAVWAFDRRETAVEVINWLAEADRVEHKVTGRAARSFADIRDTAEDFDAAGMTTIRSFHTLDGEVNR